MTYESHEGGVTRDSREFLESTDLPFIPYNPDNPQEFFDLPGFIAQVLNAETEPLHAQIAQLESELAACRAEANKVARLLAPTEVRMTTPRPRTERVGEKTFLGTILKCQFLITKKGEQMAVLELPDDTYVVVFPRVLMQDKWIIETAIEHNQTVFIEATIMKSGDNTDNVLSSIALVED